MADAEQKEVAHDGTVYPVPRDPSRYRPTTHFIQRAKDRLDDAERSDTIRSCIRRGKCYGTTPPDSDAAEVKQHFAFHWRGWRVIVGIRPAALRDADKKHLAVTVMEVAGDA